MRYVMVLSKVAERYEGGKDGLEVFRYTRRSWGDEFGAVILAHINLIMASYYLVLGYVAYPAAEAA